MTDKGKNLLIWKCYVAMIKKDAYISNEKQLQNHSSTSILKNQVASFSYQHSISFTHGLQHYRNLGQTGLHRLCGLWQVSRQIWTIFLSKNDSNYWEIKLSVQQRRQKCRILTETKPFNGRSRFQSVYSTKKSTSCCSRQLSQRTKFVASSSIYTVQRHGGATEACSRGD